MEIIQLQFAIHLSTIIMKIRNCKSVYYVTVGKLISYK